MNCCSLSHRAPYDLRRIRQYRTPAVTSTHIRDRGRGEGRTVTRSLRSLLFRRGNGSILAPRVRSRQAPYFLPFDCFSRRGTRCENHVAEARGRARTIAFSMERNPRAGD
jgi:hypothetical protein